MEKNTILKKLHNLKELLNVKSIKEKELRNARNNMNSNNNKKFNSVWIFDSYNKESFILSKIGDKPIYTPPRIKLPNFVNKAKAEYNSKLNDYNEKYKIAEKEYYEYYYDKREELRKKDELERIGFYKRAKEECSKLECELNQILEILNNVDIVSKTYWEVKTITIIISYFENNRVDTLKEAINLYHEEKRLDEEAEKAEEHRKKVENMIQELRNDMDNLISKVDDSLDDFEYKLSSLNYKIDEAYSKAEEAYSKAQEAYWEN